MVPRLLIEDARTVDWAPKGDWIAYDRPGPGGYSQLHIARPDGSSERCMTCDIDVLRKHHAASPAWHPSGKYLVFVVERPVKIQGEPLPFRSVPGGNMGSDLWAITSDAKVFWNLTNRGESGGRALSPRFSHEGDLLVWTERVVAGGGAWGQWGLQVAQFNVSRGAPRLRKVRSYRPGAQRLFYEPSSFTPDDQGLLFAANLDPGQSEAELDLFVLRLESGEIQRLRSSPDLDRSARWTPDGRQVVWASSKGLRGHRPVFERQDRDTSTAMDLWIMNADGTDEERLTRFNDVMSSEYYGRVMVGAGAWSRDGRQLIVPVVPVGSRSGGGLFVLDMETDGDSESVRQGSTAGG